MSSLQNLNKVDTWIHHDTTFRESSQAAARGRSVYILFELTPGSVQPRQNTASDSGTQPCYLVVSCQNVDVGSV